ncbi:MAG: hypothetical protein KDK90_28840, partial [Leptospiraceae bacterium]|nr:hypothetical protein [Leptospiraceae bacterium]
TTSNLVHFRSGYALLDAVCILILFFFALLGSYHNLFILRTSPVVIPYYWYYARLIPTIKPN